MNRNVILLIASNDKVHSELLKLNIRRLGIINHIISFDKGDLILDFLLQNKDSRFIVLMDIHMPGINGIRILEKLNLKVGFKKFPVIMITTTECDDEMNYCQELGCFGYFTKPLDYDSLYRSLEKAGSNIGIAM